MMLIAWNTFFEESPFLKILLHGEQHLLDGFHSLEEMSSLGNKVSEPLGIYFVLFAESDQGRFGALVEDEATDSLRVILKGVLQWVLVLFG